MKPVKISIKLAGGENSIIPKNSIENLTIEVIDGLASFHFQNSEVTRLFAEGQKKDGVDSFYNPRLQKTICTYPDMNQKEIVEHIKTRLEELSKKTKWKNRL